MEKHEVDRLVTEVIKKFNKFDSDQISFDSDLRDNYGIDSLAIVEMLVELESVFDITIDSELLTYDNFSTANAIADYIYQKIA